MTPKMVLVVSPAPDKKKMTSAVTAMGRMTSHFPKQIKMNGSAAGSMTMLERRVRI